MARTKEFDIEQALDAAIDVFRQHGYAGTSAGMLVDAMRIGRQSMYDTFGDKWQLYCAAVARYSEAERQAHSAALNRGSNAIDGLSAMIGRVVDEARRPCLGVSSVSEFGRSAKELSRLCDNIGKDLHNAVKAKIQQAQAQGDIPANLDPDEGAGFLMANVAAIRLSARGGAKDAALASLGRFALKALQ